MNPNSDYEARLNPLIGWAIGLVVVICALLLLLSVVGYGTLKINAPSGSVVTVNGHLIKTSALRLRSGSYTVLIVSPNYQPTQSTQTVRNFLTTNFSPKLKQRDPSDIMRTAIGSYAGYGPPTLGNAEWFHNNTWLAGVVGPGSASAAALHYADGDWSVAYFNGAANYPTDFSQLPPDVASYIKLQEANYAKQ